MAEFHEIGSSQFTEVTPTGNEQIQISATQKTTLQRIANLFKGQADPNSLSITDFNDSTPFSDGTQNTKVKFFVANAATVLNGPSNTGITSGNYYGIAIATGLMPTMGRVEYLLWVRGKKTLFRGYKVYMSGNIVAGSSGWEEVSGSGSLSDFIPITSMPNTGFGGLEITTSDTISTAISKISYLLGNNRVKVLGNGIDYPYNIGMIVATDNGNFNGFVLDTGDTNNLYMCYAISPSNIQGLSDESIVDWISENYDSSYNLTMLNNSYGRAANFMNIQSAAISMGGAYCVYYMGTNKSPTVTLLSSIWSKEAYFATLVVDYDVNPTFGKQSSSDVIHMHQNASEVAPTSGKKVYSIFCQIVSNVRHFFINVAPYN